MPEISPIEPAPLEELPENEINEDAMSDAVAENTPADLPGKGFFRSKTVWGAILTLLAAAASAFLGVDIELTQYAGRLADGVTVSDILIIAGSVFAVYGRVSATQRLSGPFTRE